jgi:hypothetical protein
VLAGIIVVDVVVLIDHDEAIIYNPNNEISMNMILPDFYFCWNYLIGQITKNAKPARKYSPQTFKGCKTDTANSAILQVGLWRTDQTT